MNEVEQPIKGLMIFATAADVLIEWEGLERNACEQGLEVLGIDFT